MFCGKISEDFIGYANMEVSMNSLHCLLAQNLQKLNTYQQILWLDITMTDTDATVDVCQRPADLVCIKFNIHQRHPLVHAIVVLGNSVHCLRNVFQNQIQVKLILVGCRKETMLERNNVGVVQQAHDLKLSVLVPLILKHLLDSHSLTSFDAFGLRNHCQDRPK